MSRESGQWPAANPDDFAIVPADGQIPLCGGCRTQGRCRLGVHDVVYEASNEITVRARCDPEYCGGPAVAHGGWIASIFDDALAIAVLRENPRVVTRDLDVRYRRPVPVSRPLLIIARVAEREGRTWTVTAEMLLDDPSRPVLATASAHFVSRPEEYYERHRRRLNSTER